MIDLWAWGATAAILGAYLGAALGRWGWRVFHAINVAGAPFIAVSATLHHAWPSLAITVAFAAIGVVGLVRAR